MAAITISSPIFVGVLFGQLALGIQASLGAMIVLNIPISGSLWRRQVTMLLCGLAMSASFGLGLLAQNAPLFRLPIFAIVTFALVVSGRYWRLPPPAGLFMMMAAAIALFMPVPLSQVIAKVGIVAAGSSFAFLMALLYNRLIMTARPKSSEENPKAKRAIGYDPALLTESIIVTSFVVLALAAALLLDLSHPYWVPVSCFIIMQGMQLRTMWIKQLHRLIGTAVGIIVAWFLLSLSLSPIGVAIAIFLMMFWIETMVVRHYGLAVLIITPLTIFIAEFGGGHPAQGAGYLVYQNLISARLLDTALGCLIALLGGLFMHSKHIRQRLVNIESRLLGHNKRKS